MGLSNTQVPSEQGLNWNEITLTQSSDLDQSNPPPTRRNYQQQRRQQYSESLECPRCGSTNTKFCYYNNYNKSQPRHLCKACKRHWTKGGTLRKVPVGGGRKNKRLRPQNIIASETSASSINLSAHSSHSKAHVFAQIQQKSCDQTSTTGCENFLMGDKCTLTCSAASPPENQNARFGFSSVDIALDNTPSTSSVFCQPWQDPTANIGTMGDVPSYWNWNDIDTLISTLDTTWDGTDLKF